MDLSFAMHEAALLKLEAVKCCFILPPFLSNFAEFDAENLVPILGRFWPYLARLKPVFRIKFSKFGKSQN